LEVGRGIGGGGAEVGKRWTERCRGVTLLSARVRPDTFARCASARARVSASVEHRGASSEADESSEADTRGERVGSNVARRLAGTRRIGHAAGHEADARARDRDRSA
jgi:hypothetical protein